MNRLTVLFDAACPACARFGAWAAREPVYVPLEVLALRSESARRRFPGLAPEGDAHADLVVVASGGEVWRGERAWTTALWALRDHRPRALSPGAAALARREHDAARRPPTDVPALPPAARGSARDALPAAGGGSGCLTLLLVLFALVVVGSVTTSGAEPVAYVLVALLAVVALCGVVQALLSLVAWFLFDALHVGKG